MQERIQHVLKGWLGWEGPGTKSLQGGLQGLDFVVVSQETRTLDLQEKGQERQALSNCPPPLILDFPMA